MSWAPPVQHHHGGKENGSGCQKTGSVQRLITGQQATPRLPLGQRWQECAVEVVAAPLSPAMSAGPEGSSAAPTPRSPGGMLSPPTATTNQPTPPTSCASVAEALSAADTPRAHLWREASALLARDIELLRGGGAAPGPQLAADAMEPAAAPRALAPETAATGRAEAASKQRSRATAGSEEVPASRRGASGQAPQCRSHAEPLQRRAGSCDQPRSRLGGLGSASSLSSLGSLRGRSKLSDWSYGPRPTSRATVARLAPTVGEKPRSASRGRDYHSFGPHSWASSLRDGCSPRAGGGQSPASPRHAAGSFAGAPVSWGGESWRGRPAGTRGPTLRTTSRSSSRGRRPLAMLPAEPLWRPPSRWRVSPTRVLHEWAESLCDEKKECDIRCARSMSRSSSPGSRQMPHLEMNLGCPRWSRQDSATSFYGAGSCCSTGSLHPPRGA